MGRELYGVTMKGEVMEMTESENEGINKTHVLFKVRDTGLPDFFSISISVVVVVVIVVVL